MKHLTTLSSYILAAVFVYAAIDKIFHVDGFLTALSSYLIVPDGTEKFLAPAVITAELLAGVGMLWKAWRKEAALVISGLLVVFTVALLVNYIYAPGSICGCWYTITLGKGTGTHILQNLFMLGLALTTWFESRPETQAADQQEPLAARSI